jgi:hypothetical protein
MSEEGNREKDLGSYVRGEEMSYGVIRRCISLATPYFSPNFKFVHQWEVSKWRRGRIPNPVGSFDGLIGTIVWVPSPDHWVFCTYRGEMEQFTIYDSTEDYLTPHARIIPKVKDAWKVDRVFLGRGARMTSFKVGNTCGVCAISNAVSAGMVDGVSAEPLFSLNDLAAEDAFTNKLKAIKGPSTATATEKATRYSRPLPERIKPISSFHDPPPGFPTGSVGLRRTPMDKETLKALNLKDQRLVDLLLLKWIHLPIQESVKDGITDPQRRKHLYVLMDTLSLIPTVMPCHLQRGLIPTIIAAMDLLAEQRNWQAETTKINYANALFGALIRLDQYTNLKWTLDLSNNKNWSDAMKSWTKIALRHVPETAAVTISGLHAMVNKASVGTAALMLVSWNSTGRIGNCFTLLKTDLRFELQTDGWHLAITWRAHKTWDKVGAYTVHTWLTNEWKNRLVKWMDSHTSRWLFPNRERTRLETELHALLREQNPLWEKRSFRRGALTHMAKKGVPLQDLLLFSGHKNVAMLLRYLNYGQHATELKLKGIAAAKTFHSNHSSMTQH